MTGLGAVGVAYATLVALAGWQLADGRAAPDAPATFLAGALVLGTVVAARPAARQVVHGLAVAATALAAWTVADVGVALVRHGGEPASYYAVKVAVATPVAAHNVLASLLLVGLVACALAARTDPRWRWALALVALGLAGTLSRGAVLVGLGLPVGAWLLRDRRLAARLGVASVGALALVLLAAVGLDASVPDGGGPTSVVARTQLWSAGWDAFTSHPWTGVGLDGFRDHAVGLGVADPRDHVHDLVLHAAATGGLVALAAVAVLWTTLGVRGWWSRDATVRALALLGGGALFVHGLVEETAFRPAVEVVLAGLLGTVLAHRGGTGQSGTGQSGSP